MNPVESAAYDVLGPFGKLWVEICIIGYLFGCCVAYVVVLGDLGPEILSNLELNSLSHSRIFLMTGSDNSLFVFHIVSKFHVVCLRRLCLQLVVIMLSFVFDLVICLFVIFPLSLLKDIETLNLMSTVSVAFYMLLVLKVKTRLILIANCANNVAFSQSFYQAGHQSLTKGISTGIELWRFSGVLQCVPIFSMALSCQT